MAKSTIDKLPSGPRLVEKVTNNLRQHWLGQQGHLKEMVLGLILVKSVHEVIEAWWKVLVGLLVENSKQPPDSTRALAYEKERRKLRLRKQREFSHDLSIVAQAVKLGVDERRVNHSLTSFFCAIDEVSLSSSLVTRNLFACRAR